MEQKSKFVSNEVLHAHAVLSLLWTWYSAITDREYMSSDLSADLEDFVKCGRIKSGYCNLDLFRPIMPHLMHIKLYFLQIDIFIVA